jgi:hypothetical protein
LQDCRVAHKVGIVELILCSPLSEELVLRRSPKAEEQFVRLAGGVRADAHWTVGLPELDPVNGLVKLYATELVDKAAITTTDTSGMA